MTDSRDISAQLQERVNAAAEAETPLCIRAGGSKDFYGRALQGEVLDVSGHRGIISYEPTELVITARAGTPLSEIHQVLAEQQQILPFEPPSYGSNATLGGAIACNLSGPRRPYSGAARDLVLGMKVLNGKGEILTFGGEVMKNVAGYDVSRLMAGALGTLGVILEVSVKVLPKPEAELTLVQDNLSAVIALNRFHEWARQPLPVSATSFHNGILKVRLSGSPKAVVAAQTNIGGVPMAPEESKAYWSAISNHELEFFNQSGPLWRLSLASDTPPLSLQGDQLYEWGGALRWLSSDEAADTIRDAASQAGGHATLYRNAVERDEVFQPLGAAHMKIHQQLKKAFDPKGILNPGRMYRDL